MSAMPSGMALLFSYYRKLRKSDLPSSHAWSWNKLQYGSNHQRRFAAFLFHRKFLKIAPPSSSTKVRTSYDTAATSSGRCPLF